MSENGTPNAWANNPNSPAYQRPEVGRAALDLGLIAHLSEGTRAMWEHAQAEGYIRKWKHESDDVYAIRSTSETVYEGFARTKAAAVGMLYAHPTKITWNAGEARMLRHWENLDMEGTAGDVLCKRFADAAVRDGYAIFLVDHAPRTEGVNSDNEDELGYRPTWGVYPRSSVLSWVTANIDNQNVVVQLALRDPIQVQDGAYGVKTVDRVRVLSIEPVDGAEDGSGARMGAVWRLYEENAENKETGYSEVEGGFGIFRNRAGEPAPFIPFSVGYTGIVSAPFVCQPPLMGVAWANLAHWRSSTNLEFYRQLCAFPQPTVVGKLAGTKEPAGGLGPGKLRLGPLVVVQVEEGGSFAWTEMSGTSLERLEHGVEEKERHIGQLGMSFLAPDTRQAETAEAKRIDSSAQNATLATAAQGIDDAVNLALEYHAWYLGIEKAGAPTSEINRDFDNVAMDPQVMVAYVKAVKEAGLPIRILLQAWQQAGRIPADTDLDELELEIMAGIRAREDVEAIEDDPLEEEFRELEQSVAARDT